MRVCLVLVVCALSGCSCGARTRTSDAPRTPAPRESTFEPVGDPLLFDARGALRVQSEKAFSLELPVGVARKEGAETPTFEGIVPIRAVHAFYRARLVSGEIVASGDALRFRGARPATDEGVAPESYDVSIAPLPGGRVRIVVAPRVTTTPTESEEETRRRISEAWRRQAE